MSRTVVRVPVRGGDLGVSVLSGSTEPVLAVHGISSHSRLWDWLHAEAPELSLVAPDLRGRADSVGVTGPSSLAQHVEDLVAVLDHLGHEKVHVAGMSMGGFIAVELAHLHPDRVKSLVLVDGGFPFAKHEGLTRELVPTVFADRLKRLDQAFSSVEDYVEFFTASTGPLLDPADPVLQGYCAHDLDAEGRVRLSGQVLVDDATDVFFGDLHWQQIGVPTRWCYAEWASGEGTTPMYPADKARELAALVERAVFVPGVDHAGAIMSKQGALVVAELLHEALESRP